jgi:hypothetical protein
VNEVANNENNTKQTNDDDRYDPTKSDNEEQLEEEEPAEAEVTQPQNGNDDLIQNNLDDFNEDV